MVTVASGTAFHDEDAKLLEERALLRWLFGEVARVGARLARSHLCLSLSTCSRCVARAQTKREQRHPCPDEDDRGSEREAERLVSPARRERGEGGKEGHTGQRGERGPAPLAAAGEGANEYKTRSDQREEPDSRAGEVQRAVPAPRRGRAIRGPRREAEGGIGDEDPGGDQARAINADQPRPPGPGGAATERLSYADRDR